MGLVRFESWENHSLVQQCYLPEEGDYSKGKMTKIFYSSGAYFLCHKHQDATLSGLFLNRK